MYIFIPLKVQAMYISYIIFVGILIMSDPVSFIMSDPVQVFVL